MDDRKRLYIGIGLILVIAFLIVALPDGDAATQLVSGIIQSAFLAAIVAVPGMPVRAVVLTLLYSVGLMGVLTPYATGPAPVWFNAGYIAPRDFWKLGAITGAMYLLALVAVELPYLLYVHR